MMNKYSVLAVASIAAALTAPSLALADSDCGVNQFPVTVEVNALVALSVSKPSNPSDMDTLYVGSSETYCYTNGQLVSFSYPDLSNGADLFTNGSNLFDSDSWNTTVTYRVQGQGMNVSITQDDFTAKLICTTDSGAACS